MQRSEEIEEINHRLRQKCGGCVYEVGGECRRFPPTTRPVFPFPQFYDENDRTHHRDYEYPKVSEQNPACGEYE